MPTRIAMLWGFEEERVTAGGRVRRGWSGVLSRKQVAEAESIDGPSTRNKMQHARCSYGTVPYQYGTVTVLLLVYGTTTAARSERALKAGAAQA